MNWLQLELATGAAELPELEAQLLEWGALAITLASEQDEQILEPAPGETPLWSLIRLRALFDLDADLADLRARIASLNLPVDVQLIGEQDWQAQAQSFAADQVFADKLHLRPPLQPGEHPDPRWQPLYLTPGLAFGSGTHPTTQLCLAWLAEHVQPDMRVLDFGAGSGILAIAACLLGATSTAVDHDTQAVQSGLENAARNGLNSQQIQVLHSDQWSAANKGAATRKFDVVVANILAEPLKLLAQEIEDVMQPGAALVLSGILQEQVADVAAAYTRVQFQPATLMAGWACLHGVRTDRGD